MKHGYYESKPFTHNNAKRTHTETISLYSGIELAFPFASEIESFYFYHKPLTHILEINYCISGKIKCSKNDGNGSVLPQGNLLCIPWIFAQTKQLPYWMIHIKEFSYILTWSNFQRILRCL